MPRHKSASFQDSTAHCDRQGWGTQVQFPHHTWELMGRGSVVLTPNSCPGMLERVQHSYEPLPAAEPACGLKEPPVRPQLCPKELSKHGACLRNSRAGGWHMSSHFPIP